MLAHPHKLHTASIWYPNTSWDLSFPTDVIGLQLINMQTKQNKSHADTHIHMHGVWSKTLCMHEACCVEWASAVYLDDLVLWFEACSLCWRVFVHSSDELARFGLLAVQVEAIALRSLLHVAETRPQATFLLLHKTAAEILDFLKSLQHAWLWVLPGTTKVLPSPWNIYGSP